MDLQGIKKARKAAHFTQNDLAKKVGLNRATISKYESGEIIPPLLQLRKIAIALNTTVYEMIGADWSGIDMTDALADIPEKEKDTPTSDGASKTDGLPSNLSPMPKMRRIPLIGTIACGEPILAEENFEGEVDLPENIRADFALRCQGDSMINARIFDGDIVYISIDREVNDGDIVAVRIGDEATLKRIYRYPTRLELRPENPTFPVLQYEGEQLADVQIIGKAVAFTSTVR